MEILKVKDITAAIRENIETVILGKTSEIQLVLATLLANGHVLLEDVPGTGKTVLAKALAHSFSCEFGRVQFTPDLLPSELTGINFYNPKTGEFNFREGSLFANIILADEINRATPRTQSGLLESMEEKQITVDGQTFKLRVPYFVIATQNPIETQGTFPLPEAQLDRFFIQLSLGYPTSEESVNVLKKFISNEPLTDLKPICSTEILLDMQETVKSIYIHDDVYRYIVALAEATRSHEGVSLGVSTRGCLALARMAQAYAAIHGLPYVTPDHIQHLLPYVFGHRIILRGGMRNRTSTIETILTDTLSYTTAPVEDWKAK